MNDFTKEKISASVRQNWAEKSEIEKERIAQKKRETMLRLWSQVRRGDDENQ